jgi:hypothetical protein
MKTITGRVRKILSMILSVPVASLILPACPAYGNPPPYDETSISVKVRANETGEPIFGIKVSIEGSEYWNYTDKDGYFSVWVPIRNEYKIKLEDVDGPYNGGLFKEQTWTIRKDDTNKLLLIGMDLVP